LITPFVSSNCPGDQIKCSDVLQCITPRFLCNDYVNCNDGSDESAATCKDRVDGYVSITAYSMWPKALPHVKKYPYIINQNQIFSKNYCEVISG
jgi:hypothetical protein